MILHGEGERETSVWSGRYELIQSIKHLLAHQDQYNLVCTAKSSHPAPPTMGPRNSRGTCQSPVWKDLPCCEASQMCGPAHAETHSSPVLHV